MGAFEDLMETYRNPGDNGIPATFADDIAKAHADDLSLADAAVKQRETANASIMEQLNKSKQEELRLKAVVYDVMNAAPKPGEPDNPDNGGNGDGDRPRGINALFETK